MNVFEDLIDELKAENLLEATVLSEQSTEKEELSVNLGNVKPVTFESIQPDVVSIAGESAPFNLQDHTDLLEIHSPVDEKEFFRKRAMEEVSSLQMVEHVLSGVEREHMKMVPVSYDDLAVKKALHKFLQVSGNLKSEQHAETEYLFLQEAEGWCSALSVRDKNISVANIRRFCENSRPVLSSQALMALGRFYRNTPCSESVRGKFDFVMTRLFSRDIEGERRRLLVDRSEMIAHIKTLYANWSSISLYSPVEDEAEISRCVKRFDDLINEAESAKTFDELLETDFFNKIRLFKEDTNELFFVPEVAAAAIESNVRIGNKYVNLILKEKDKSDAGSIEEKYGYTYDQIVSHAAGKTLLLVDLLRRRPEHNNFESEDQALVSEDHSKSVPAYAATKNAEPTAAKRRITFDLFGVSKGLLAATIAVVVISVGIYVWAEKTAGTQPASLTAAKTVEISNAELKNHLSIARSTGDTLYGVTQPSFEAMNPEQQKEFLHELYNFAAERGMKKVNLSNANGRTVGYASKGRVEVIK